VSQQTGRTPGVLGSNEIASGQCFARPCAQIAKIADGRRNDTQLTRGRRLIVVL
jgi:hypothetical protein